jgi:predicted phosphodiesterase
VTQGCEPTERKIALVLEKLNDPKWQPIDRAQPVILAAPKKVTPKKSKHTVHIALPDPQIGYRSLDGRLDPFHDESAMDIALQITDWLEENDRVDTVINLGDFLDLPAQGRFEQEAAFASTSQAAFDRGHLFLQQQRLAAGPKAKIVLVEGNHDRRMEKFIVANALSAYGLRRANTNEIPVMSIPYLLRLNEIGVEYIDAYPAGAYWITENLRAIHGTKARSNGSTAAAYTNADPHISTIFGHAHRLEIQSRTVFNGAGAIRSVAVSPGCLCRVDGAVPSVNGSTHIDGSPAKYFENWQQGICVISINEDGEPFFEMVQIKNGEAWFRGNRFKARLNA